MVGDPSLRVLYRILCLAPHTLDSCYFGLFVEALCQLTCLVTNCLDILS